MKRRIAKKIIKRSGDPHKKTIWRRKFISSNGRVCRLIHVKHIVYLPYTNEQIFEARRTARDIASKYGMWYMDHGRYAYAPVPLDIGYAEQHALAPIRNIKSRYELKTKENEGTK